MNSTATRQTGGVRNFTESEFLEDVYTMNDFILGEEELGGNRPRTPLRPPRETTGLDRPVPYWSPSSAATCTRPRPSTRSSARPSTFVAISKC